MGSPGLRYCRRKGMTVLTGRDIASILYLGCAAGRSGSRCRSGRKYACTPGDKPVCRDFLSYSRRTDACAWYREVPMSLWETWLPQRFFYLFIGAAYLLVWIQVVLFHWRGAFRHAAMWGPVLFAPFLSAMGIVFAFVHGGIVNWIFIIIYAIGTLSGMMGAVYHFKGVRHYIGGFTLRNFMVGPPVILPLMFLSLSAGALLMFFLWPPQGGF